MSLAALPTTSTASRRIPIWTILVVLAACGLAYLGWTYVRARPAVGTFVGNYQAVTVGDLDVRLSKDGELQAVNNIDVINKVEGHSLIQELVQEGTFVHKGDVLVTLDSSDIQKAYDQSLLDLQSAEANLSAAKEAKEIQESTNAANLQQADVALEVAQLDLREYVEGTSKAAEEEGATKVKMAEIMLKNKEEDLAITRNLFAKGFVTQVDVKKGELDVLTCQNDFVKAQSDLNVLKVYTKAKDLATKRSAVAQAEKTVIRTKKENAANLNRYEAALVSAEQTLNLRKQLTAKLKDQLDNCVIRAPGDGLVVYASSSDRSGNDPIKEGGTVRNQQVLCRLPDTSSMKAVIRVQEGQVSKLRVDDNNPMRATVQIVGFKKPIGASVSKISVLADSSQRWWNPDLKEYPVELVLDETPPNCKPGLGCQVELLIDRKQKVLNVPLTAIYSQGNQSFVFVRDASGGEPKPIEVRIGATNDTHAEISGPVAVGSDVLLLQPGQGRLLLEKAGIKIQPTARPGETNKPRKRNNGNNNGGGAGNGAKADAGKTHVLGFRPAAKPNPTKTVSSIKTEP
ncbi:MAG TPA: biotin/lipoyl-binding protein [Tepidisphaeraceae bacterium]|jgi:multidrug efflux pump subunit AcrA (membrane-fusion protein)